MSEKRFTSKDYDIDYYTEIVDNEKELDHTIPNPSQRLLIGEAVDLLNEQDQQIKQLKKELSESKEDHFKFNVTEYNPKLTGHKNTLELEDKHTKIKIKGDDLNIIITPPNTEPFTFYYLITGIVFDEHYKNIHTRRHL